MPLDPQAATFLEQLAALKLKPVEESTAAEAREMMLASIAGLGPPEEVEKIDERRVPGPGGEIPLRVYAPTSHAGGAVVYFHGGGWVTGDLETHDGFCRALANAAGCVVASVDYRLAPEHVYPAAAEDAYAATRWVCENAASLGVDARRIAVAGDSAGGNLAAVVSLMNRDRGGPPLALQVLIYPITDCDLDRPSYHEFAEGYLLTRAGTEWFWQQYAASEDARLEPYASPFQAADLAGLPPAVVITAECDPLRDEGEAYAARLQAAGVAVRMTRYDGMIHGFLRRLNSFDAAKRALAEIAESLQAAFDTAV